MNGTRIDCDSVEKIVMGVEVQDRGLTDWRESGCPRSSLAMAPSLLDISEDAIGLVVAHVLQSGGGNPCAAHRAAARSPPLVCRGLLEHLQRTRPLLHLQAAEASIASHHPWLTAPLRPAPGSSCPPDPPPVFMCSRSAHSSCVPLAGL